MKITYVFTTVDAAAGTERAVITQANSFARLGHTVTVMSIYKTASSPSFEIDSRIEVKHLVDLTETDLTNGIGEVARNIFGQSRLVPIRWDDQYCLQSDLEVTSAMRAETSDIVVTTTPALAALAAQFLPPETVIVHEEHRASMQRSSDSIEPLDLFGPRLDAVVSLTELSTKWLRDRFNTSAPRLETIRNSVPAIFYPQSDLEAPLLISAGRFARAKNFEGLIRAFSLVADKFPGWKLRIYGSGPCEASMRRTARKLDIEDVVEIVPAVPNLMEEWSKGSVFVYASHSEGLPLVILEAAAAGLPLVAYDCLTGPSEVIDDGKNGFLVPLGNEAALADSMSRLMASPELRSVMGAAASRTVSRFSPTQIESEWISLFTALLKERGSQSTRVARMQLRQGELLDSFARRTAEEGRGPRSENRPHPTVVPAHVNASELTPTEQAGRATAITVDLLQRSGVTYVWIPSGSSLCLRFAAPLSDRNKVFAAVAEISDRAVELTPLNGRGHATGAPWIPAVSSSPPPVFEDCDVVLLRRFEIDETGTISSQDARCEIEFWSQAEDDRLQPPRANSIVDLVDRSDFESAEYAKEQGVVVPSLPLGLATPWREPEFPIDAVFTWVDGNDAAWQQSKARFGGRLPMALHAEADSSARYRNRDELKYALRSIHAYAPWINHIYVVTAGQRPEWFDSSDPQVTFVDHCDIFTDVGMLPTFNSHAIESQLHHIDELSEHFLYFNDDVMLRSYQKKSQFFFPNGIMKFFPSPTKINDLHGEVPPHQAAAMRNRDLLQRDFGITITQSLLHAPYPQKKSLLDELESSYKKEWNRTAGARFRGDADHSTVSSLAPYYAFATGRAVPGSLRVAYLGLADQDLQQKMISVIRGKFDVFSLGEPSGGVTDPDLVDHAVANFLEEVLPIPGPWERPAIY